MMKTALRLFGGTFAGLIASFILIVLVEIFSGVVHPFPSEFQGTQEEICRHVERYPAWVLAVAVPMWAVAAFTGVWIARRIGGINAAAMVGLLLLAALVCNVSTLPYPTWFKVACMIAIPASILGGVFAWRRKTPSPTAIPASGN